MKSSGGESEITRMRLFKRKSVDQTTAPVQEYYQTEQHNNKAMAWLLAFVTFLVTLVVILALFYAGKWTYDKIKNKDSDNSQQTTQPQADTSQSSNNTESNTPSSGTNSNQQNVQGQHVDSTPQTSSTNTSTPSQAITQPNTGPSELVHTGPDQDL